MVRRWERKKRTAAFITAESVRLLMICIANTKSASFIRQKTHVRKERSKKSDH